MQVMDAFIQRCESSPESPDLALGFCQVGIRVGAESLHGHEARKRRLQNVFASSHVQPRKISILGGVFIVLFQRCVRS